MTAWAGVTIYGDDQGRRIRQNDKDAQDNRLIRKGSLDRYNLISLKGSKDRDNPII